MALFSEELYNQTLQACRDWYEMPGNEGGGDLHVVLDDGNVSDDSLNWCRGWCDAKNNPDGSALLLNLLMLDDISRDRLYDELSR